MLVAIHQLHYLPWLRYFEKIARADLFIVLDDIQFNKNGWQNRNKIKSPNGPELLTVPVLGSRSQTLDQIRINPNPPWRRKHWRAIEQHYRDRPFFHQHATFLQETYAQQWTHLNHLNRHMLHYFVQAIGTKTPLVYSSELKPHGIATERLINLIQAVGGDTYYCGTHSLDTYLDKKALDKAGIALQLQDWTAPVYAQRYEPFIPDLSVLDLLMNCGPESGGMLAGRKKPAAGETLHGGKCRVATGAGRATDTHSP